MSFGPVLTDCADLAREMPEDSGARLDRVDAALASLRAEQHRLERLGFESPLRTCHEQRRYWEFLGALFSLDPRGSR